jgi:NAD(P)-dependent dehydrogenase (short-subunit alcohol dehydrogenase family)
VLNARSGDQLERVAQEIRQGGGTALAVPGDISRAEDCRELVSSTVAAYGRIDALVNNAAVLEPIAPISEAEPAEWNRNLTVNVLGPMMLTQAALPYLRRSNGRVINVSSGAALRPIPGTAGYSVAKAALNQFTRALAVEEKEITAIAVRPGVVDTDMQAAIRQDGRRGMPEETYARFTDYHESGQLLPPEAPGWALAALALYAPKEWSGEFLSWDEGRVRELVGRDSPS